MTPATALGRKKGERGEPGPLPVTAKIVDARVRALEFSLSVPSGASSAFLLTLTASILAGKLPALDHAQHLERTPVASHLSTLALLHASVPRHRSGSEDETLSRLLGRLSLDNASTPTSRGGSADDMLSRYLGRLSLDNVSMPRSRDGSGYARRLSKHLGRVSAQ